MYCSPHRLQLTIKRSQVISDYFGQFEIFVLQYVHSLHSITQEHSRTFQEAQTCGYQLNLSSGIGFRSPSCSTGFHPLILRPQEDTFRIFRGLIRDGLYPTSRARILVLSITGTINFARTMDISNYDNNETALTSHFGQFGIFFH